MKKVSFAGRSSLFFELPQRTATLASRDTKRKEEEMTSSSIRPIALMGAFVVGYLWPQGAAFDWTIPWFVRFMIFMVFLKLEVRNMKLRRSHIALLVLNLLVGVVSCEALKLAGRPTLALAAFFTGIAPTATAAPAIAGFLGRDVEYVVTGLLTTTFGVSLGLPALLPWVLGEATPGAFVHVAGNVGGVIVVPIVAARIFRFVYPPCREWTGKLKNLTFFAWVGMVTVLSSRATAFVYAEENGVDVATLAAIGALSLAICALNFFLGYCVGEKNYRSEASQTLGQKNTGALIYFAILYANPLVALGPTLYVFWHNSWNAIQLERLALRERRAAKENEARREPQTSATLQPVEK